MFVAAAASCLAVTFTGLAARAGLTYTSLNVDADGIAGQRSDGHFDQDTAAAHRFLGSPTVRVDGRDVEFGAERRDEVVLGCRIYRTDAGLSGRPDERWVVRDAVSRASRAS